MKNRHGIALPLSASLTVLALAGGAAAQAAREPGGLEEVVVTARRVEENLQTVPITVQAFSPEVLQQQNIDNPNKLGMLVPGLSFCCSANASQPNTTFRGVPGIIGYYAEAPSSLDGRALYFDLANVQVLKGPQGTLFGLSANSGALLIEPKRPVNKFEGYVQGTLGNYGRRTIEGAINIPLVDDKLLVRAGVISHHRAGWLRDLTQQRNVSDENYWTGRFSATLKASESIENYFTVNYHKFHNHGDPMFLESANPVGPAATRFGAATVLGYLFQQQALPAYQIIGTDLNTVERRRQLNMIDILTWSPTDNLTIKNIAGWLQTKVFSIADSDSTPLQISQGNPLTVPPGPTDQYSDELQAQGKLLDGKLSYTLGTFHSWVFTNPSVAYSTSLGSVSGNFSESAQNTHGAYAQATYDLSNWIDGVSFTGGYRYNWDFRKTSGIRYNAAQQAVGTTAFGQSGHWRASNYTLQLNYQVTPDVMFYVNNSKGYSSGGFNANGTPAAFLKFAPESLNNIEGGVKAEWRFGNVEARTNISAYYGFYDNVQVTVSKGVPNPLGGIQIITITENAAKGYVSGFDADFMLVFDRRFEMSGTVGYNKDRYKRWLSLDSAGNVVDLKNTPFRYTPKWKGSATVTYHFLQDTKIGDMAISGTWSAQSPMIGSQPLPQYAWPGVYQINADLTWTDVMATEGLDASLFVTNLTENKIDPGAKFGGYVPIGVGAARWKPPRMYGAKVRYGF